MEVLRKDTINTSKLKRERSVIILGLTAQGLALLRSLSRNGFQVTAFYQNPKNVGVYSKYGTKIRFDEIEDLKIHINSLISKWGYKPLCFITSGELLAQILQLYPELYELCNVSSGPHEVVEMLAHKDKMYCLAKQKGFTVARYTTLDKYTEGDFDYPLFMKRNFEIPLFFKAVKVKDREAMSAFLSQIKEAEKQHIIVQEWINIPKPDLMNITGQAFYNHGVAKGHFVANQIRKLKKGLTSYLEEITDEKLVKRIIEAMDSFMYDLGYNGFAEFEYMYDRDNEILYFLEVNTRTCGSHSSLNYKFKNIATVVVNPETNENLVSVEKPVKWMNIIRDIRCRFETKDFGHLGEFVHCNYDILDKYDLGPFLHQLL